MSPPTRLARSESRTRVACCLFRVTSETAPGCANNASPRSPDAARPVPPIRAEEWLPKDQQNQQFRAHSRFAALRELLHDHADQTSARRSLRRSKQLSAPPEQGRSTRQTPVFSTKHAPDGIHRFSLTPGPPPFASTNITPASSSARRMDSRSVCLSVAPPASNASITTRGTTALP